MSEFFGNLQKNKSKGIFISGDEINGEFKQWYLNGQIFKHCFYKDGKCDGEYKRWYPNGQLCEYLLLENGRVIKDLLKK